MAPPEPIPEPARVRWITLAIPASFIVVGVFAVVAPWVVRARDREVDANGARAVATIAAVAPPLGAGGDGEFTISYSFVTGDGRPQRATRAVSETFWRTAVEGQAVDVVYDPAQPANNHPVGFGQTSLGVALFVSGVGLVIGAFGLVLLVALVRRSPVADEPDPQ